MFAELKGSHAPPPSTFSTTRCRPLSRHRVRREASSAQPPRSYLIQPILTSFRSHLAWCAGISHGPV
ncbi:hypothetical protein C8Q79DRAFT_748440 [Trametes meyenii]|nr:hypothetical protein C8Q79DRAFT_748440 [Trametes meyenii]